MLLPLSDISSLRDKILVIRQENPDVKEQQLFMVPLSEEEIAKNRDYMNFILESEKD